VAAMRKGFLAPHFTFHSCSSEDALAAGPAIVQQFSGPLDSTPNLLDLVQPRPQVWLAAAPRH
jgi:hypothetical protein